MQLAYGGGSKNPLQADWSHFEAANRRWRFLHEEQELLVVQMELVPDVVQTIPHLAMQLYFKVVSLGKHLDKEVGDILDTLVIRV